MHQACTTETDLIIHLPIAQIYHKEPIHRTSSRDNRIMDLHQKQDNHRTKTAQRRWTKRINEDSWCEEEEKSKPRLWPVPFLTVWHRTHFVLKIFSPTFGLPGRASAKGVTVVLTYGTNLRSLVDKAYSHLTKREWHILPL